MRQTDCVTESQSADECSEARRALTLTPACREHNLDNPAYEARDLHDFPYGHGSRPCPFGFNHHSVK